MIDPPATVVDLLRATLEKLEQSPEIAKDEVATAKLRSHLLRVLAELEMKKAS